MTNTDIMAMIVQSATTIVIGFVLAGIGFKPAGDRVHLVGLGLAAFIFVLAWNALAAT